MSDRVMCQASAVFQYDTTSRLTLVTTTSKSDIHAGSKPIDTPSRSHHPSYATEARFLCVTAICCRHATALGNGACAWLLKTSVNKEQSTETQPVQHSTLPSAIDTTGTLILRPPGRCMRPLGLELSRSPSPIRMMPQLGAATSVKSSAVSRVDSFPNACDVVTSESKM